MNTIGRYRLTRRIGSGAFATVWFGHDDDLDVPVAIKVLAENWATNADVRERFLAEARLLRRIDSPRVMRVHDLGVLTTDGLERPYFVMDYADGGTLDDLVASRVTPATALRLGAQTAYAVHVLHEHGVLHRDVKPSNILLTSRGGEAQRVVVADLGMAKALADSSGLTVTAGTPAYMAPEQAYGSEGFDQRADVYSVAAVTYTLLQGRPPYNTDAGLGSVLGRDPLLRPPVFDQSLDLPPRVYRVVADALSFRSADRPRTALELGTRLDDLAERVEAGESSLSADTGAVERVVPAGHDSPAVLAAVEFGTPDVTAELPPLVSGAGSGGVAESVGLVGVGGGPGGSGGAASGRSGAASGSRGAAWGGSAGSGRGVAALVAASFVVFAAAAYLTMLVLGR